MSLELLKEKFGHSGVIKKSDNREQLQERLNAQFNVTGDFKDIKIQHQEELEEKDRIIKNLETQTSELATEVLALEKDKATLLDNLNKSKWMEEKVQLLLWTLRQIAPNMERPDFSNGEPVQL